MRLFAGVLSCFFLLSCATGPKAFRSGRSGLFDGTKTAPGPRGSVSSKAEVSPALSREDERLLQARAKSWVWPTGEVKVTSRFGERGESVHEGIDLRAPIGTPVYSVSDGKVAYADQRISGYGKMVVVKHGNGISTLYAHNSKLKVRAGQQVSRGQLLAYSGNTGRSSGPHVHFEVRHGLVPVDPERVMPTVGPHTIVRSPSRQEPSRQLASQTPKKRPPDRRQVAKLRPKKQIERSRISQSSARRPASSLKASRRTAKKGS